MAEYIDREAAKKLLVQDYAYAAANLLDYLVAADVEEVKHGRWNKVSWWQHQNRYECNECSLCGCRVKPKFTYNFCPNCGAKMDGGKENG